MKSDNIWKAARTRISNYEPAVIAIFLVASVAGFIFLRLTREMLEGETRIFDEALLRALRQQQDPGIPIGPSWLTKALTDITSLGGVTVLTLVTLLSVIYLLLVRKRIAALFVLLSVLGGWLISSSLKLGVARPRPDIVPHLVDVHDFSFPSGHAMLSAVTYLTLGLMLAQMQGGRAVRYYFMLVAIVLTLLIGVSRVYLGVHYPTDVLGGWCAGAAWACLCWLIGRWLIPNGEQRSDVVSPTAE